MASFLNFLQCPLTHQQRYLRMTINSNRWSLDTLKWRRIRIKYVSDTDTLRILADTYSQNIIINYFKLIKMDTYRIRHGYTKILIKYLKDIYRRKDEG